MNTRNYFIDIAKYITIFFVIWGHIIQRSWVFESNIYSDYIYQTIYSFHMPLFMGLCGYLFHKSLTRRGFREYYRNKLPLRIKSLLIPMISFGILQIFVLFICNNFSYTFSISDLFQKIHGIWFLGDLLINTVIVFIIYKYSSGNFRDDCKLFVVGSIFSLVPIIGYSGQGLFMYIFFVIGYCISAYINNIVSWTKYYWLFFSLYILFSILFNISPYSPQAFFLTSHLDHVDMMLFIDFIKVSVGILGSYLVLLTVYKALPYIQNTFLGHQAIEQGKNTLEIYLLNTIIIDIFFEKIYLFIIKNFNYNYIYDNGLIIEIITSFTLSIIAMEVIILCSNLLHKNKWISKILFYR